MFKRTGEEMPKSNKRYWEPKIERNLKRDLKVNESLGKMGWKVIRIWEHEIKNDLDKSLEKVLREL